MTKQLAAALLGLAFLTFGVVWAVVHYSFVYVGGRGFTMMDMVQTPVNVPIGDAARVQIALYLYYGDLQLTPGTEALLAGSTRYNVAEFAPHLVYAVEDKRGQLQMDHLQGADYTHFLNRTGRVNQWQLALNDQVPIDDLHVIVGLGNGQLDLRGVAVRHSELELIAGDFTVDLRGAWTQNSAMEIIGVTGTMTVLVPSETGTLVTVDGGPRTLYVTGLTALTVPPVLPFSTPGKELNAPDEEDEEENDENNVYYVNAAYGESPTLITIHVSHAFGTLHLVGE